MTGPLSDAKHPLWSLLRLSIIMTALTLILLFSAQNFDHTEVRTIIQMFLGVGVTEGLVRLVQK